MSINSSFHTGLVGLPWKNTSDTEAPPHACVAGDGALEDKSKKTFIIVGRKPSLRDVANPMFQFYANGASAVAPGGIGLCYRLSEIPVWAAMTDTTGSPLGLYNITTQRPTIGPKSDSWEWHYYEAPNPIARAYSARLAKGGLGEPHAETGIADGKALIVSDPHGPLRHARYIRILAIDRVSGSRRKFLDSGSIHNNCSGGTSGPYWIDGVFTYKDPWLHVFQDTSTEDEIGHYLYNNTQSLHVFAGSCLKGVLMADSICLAIPTYARSISNLFESDEIAWIAIDGGETSFTGSICKISEHPKYGVIPDQTLQDIDGLPFLTLGGSDDGVDCYSAFGDSFSIGQRVAVAWDSRPRRLRITDWGCPT